MADRAAIQDLLDKMREQRDALLAEAAALSEADAESAPADAVGEAQWCAKEQLAHLAEMETAYRAWVQCALDEDDPDLSRVRGEPPAIGLHEAKRHPVHELAAQLTAQREKTLRLIDAMAPDQFERTASQPMFGRLTVMQWLRSYYRHDRMHRDQLAGREPDYKPKFVGGQEPDQRRGRRI